MFSIEGESVMYHGSRLTNFLGRKNSLFPERPVIKWLMIVIFRMFTISTKKYL